MKKTTVLGIFCSLLAFSNANAGDIEVGKEKAMMCIGCHGADGYAANPDYPNLAGQNAGYIELQIKAFKNGNRKNELMSPMAQSISADDIPNIAAYFNSLKAR